MLAGQSFPLASATSYSLQLGLCHHLREMSLGSLYGLPLRAVPRRWHFSFSPIFGVCYERHRSKGQFFKTLNVTYLALVKKL
jgi:hypothetical protein